MIVEKPITKEPSIDPLTKSRYPLELLAPSVRHDEMSAESGSPGRQVESRIETIEHSGLADV